MGRIVLFRVCVPIAPQNHFRIFSVRQLREGAVGAIKESFPGLSDGGRGLEGKGEIIY